MSSLSVLLGFLKKLAVFALILAVAIPFQYGSTNVHYLGFRLLHLALSIQYSVLPDQGRSELSADYVAFENILRMKAMAVRDPTADPITKVKELRATFSIGNIIPKPYKCQVNREIFEHDGHSVDTYWINYPSKTFQKDSDKLLIYFHGGGYMLGDIQAYSGFECRLSKLFNLTVLHIEYRLSPEHSLPNAVDDAVTVYLALLRDNILSSQLIFMGDSAGGGLCLLTTQTLIARQLSIPRGIIALSPWTDLSMSGESYIRNSEIDAMLNIEDAKWITSMLLGHNQSQRSPKDPSISPLFGSFKGFPSMYVTVGTAEILEDDSRGVVKKAQEANVDVTFEEGLHLVHVYPIFYNYFPEARKTLNNINKWVQTIFHRKYDG